jgi:hypothetical protein
MDANSVILAVSDKMNSIGGQASVLNETCIVLSWNHMSGLVLFTPEGPFVVKVSTPWKDEDAATVDRPEDVPGKVGDLFQNFWARRGINFSHRQD